MAVLLTKVSNFVLIVLIVAGVVIFVHYKFTNDAYEFSLPLNKIIVTETLKESGMESIKKTLPQPILRMAFLKKT